MATLDADELERQFNEQEYQRYLADVLEANARRREQNPMFRRVDPSQPAFSEEAEKLRQLQAIEKSNTGKTLDPEALERMYQATRNVTEAGRQLGLPQEQYPTTPENRAFQVTPATLYSVYQAYRPDWGKIVQPLPQTGPFEGEEALERKFGEFLLGGYQELAAPFATARDYVLGAITGAPGTARTPAEVGSLFGEPSTDWRKNVIPAIIETGLDIVGDPLALFGPSLMRAAARRGTIPQVTPASTDVDVSIAGEITPRGVGEPDYPPSGPRTLETGRTLTVPALEPGEMTSAKKYPIRYGRPTLVPGEFEDVPPVTEGQTSLLAHPEVGGKRIREAGEQLGMGEVPLRPQRQLRVPSLTKPDVKPPIQETVKTLDYIQETLKKIAKREEGKRLIRESYAPQQDYRITLQTSPRGSVSVIEAERDSGLRYSKIPGAPSDIPLVFPGWPSRITQSIVDTLKQIGPPGVNIGNAVESVLSNRAVLSSADVIKATTRLTEIAGTRGTPTRFIEGFRELMQGENAFIWGTHRYWNLTPEEVEQVWNYLYTQGRMIPASTKARAFGDALYETMLYGPSRAAHEAGLQLYNPLTGKHEEFGAPSMFMPQIPVHPTSIKNISDTHLQLLYQRQGTDMPFPLWKAQLQRILSQGGELREAKAAGEGFTESGIRYDMASKRYKGLEVTRLLDLEALGGSPYQWAKKFGYETDPFRAAFRYNSTGYLRTEWARAMPQIEMDMAAIAERGGQDLTEWVVKAINRSQGINTGLDESRLVRQIGKGVRDFNNVTMLQLSAAGSLPQLGYALGRAPILQSILGGLDFVVGNNRKLLESSGALYPSLMNMMVQPEGPLAIASTGALRSYGTSLLDKWSRAFGGHVGIRYVDFLEKSLLKYPGKERLHKLVEEIGGDVNTIIREGHIPEPMKMAMIQKYANYAAGIPDPRGLPLIATSETAYWRAVNQYRTFLFNNGAELTRLWKQSPTLPEAISRITKVVLGTGALGGVSEAVRNAITDGLSDSDKNLFVNKTLKEVVGDEGAAFLIQTVAYSLGALYGALALTALDNGWKFAAQLTGGPTASLAVGLAEDTVDSLIHGPGWRSVRTVARRLPILGPTASSIVREEIAEETRQNRQREQLRRSLTDRPGRLNQP